MSETREFRDYADSRAVLVGTAKYDCLRQIPAAAISLRRFGGLLTGDLCGWPAERVTIIEDELLPGELPDRLITSFQDTRGVALFYFVGHGQVDINDELCLALVKSRPEAARRAATSLRFQAVRAAMLASPASTKIIVLDCCFAGLASKPAQSLGPDDISGMVGGTGAYTMCATGSYATAWFDHLGTSPQTYFTKYLIDLIEVGMPKEPAGLRLRRIFLQVHDNLARDGLPNPVDRAIDSGGDFVFARNVALSVATTVASAQPPTDVGGSAVGEAGAMSPDIARLLAEARNLLASGRPEAFRSVQFKLQEKGYTARPQATFLTSMGSFVVELLPDYAPNSVRHFIELTEAGLPFYDGTVFYRVIRKRLIHGGRAEGSTENLGRQFADEIHPKLTFAEPYLLAWANRGTPDTDGPQFFITAEQLPAMTGRFTIFGRVVDGSTAVDAIASVAVDSDGRPRADVVLESVQINQSPGGLSPARRT